MKKRKPLKTSFVVTFAGTASMAVAATGCFTDTITNPPPAASCPAELPAYGADCEAFDVPVEGCVFESADECGNDVTATCVDGAWELQYEGTCNPPMVTCPETRPTHGDPCEDGVGTCEYPDVCSWPIVATCQSSTWDVQIPPTCNPPPCNSNETAEVCGADVRCRWLTPGCADEGGVALAQEGCFPATPCADDTECLAPLTCQEVVVLPPCEDGDTCTCAAPTKVCL